MIPIPYAKEYSATASGRIIKEVNCQSCRRKYYYDHHVDVEGHDISLFFLDNQGAQSRATHNTEKELRRQLRLPKAVPCPHCGYYQQEMLNVARADRLENGPLGCIVGIGLVAFVIGAVVALIAGSIRASRASFPLEAEHWFWVATGVVTVSGLLACLIVFLLNSRFDPNGQDVAKRIRTGRQLSLSADQLPELERGDSQEQSS